jgi:enamine deaminase RidA (YjgF/YER057c/UK114 family)
MIRCQHQPGLTATFAGQGSLHELHCTVWPMPGESLDALIGRIHALVQEQEVQIVRQEIFGDVRVGKEMRASTRARFGALEWPMVWAEGTSCFGGSIAGVHFMAVGGVEVHRMAVEGGGSAAMFESGGARHCFLGGLRPSNLGLPRAAQAVRLYEQLERALEQAGMDLSHLARTWFFLDDILCWYGEFNEVRNKVYSPAQLVRSIVPASTGIGARNPFGAALVGGAWAVRTTAAASPPRVLASPLQCGASIYGSCFSRAVELNRPGLRHLLISGTASIDPQGRSAHAGDAARQIELTMRVVEEILRSEQMSFADVTRGTAYLKSARDASLFSEWCAARGLTRTPILATRADICRDELLFELELDAMKPASPEGTTVQASGQS